MLEWLEGAELTLSAPQFFGFPFVRSLGAEQKFLNLAKHYWNCLLPAPALLKSKGAWLQQGVWQGPKAPLQGAQLCAGCTVSPQAGEGAGGVPGKVGRAGSTPGHWEVSLPKQDELQAPSKPFWDAIIPAIIPSVELDLGELGEKIHECKDQMWVLWNSVTYHCQGDLEGSVKSFLESSAGDTRMVVSSFGYGSF